RVFNLGPKAVGEPLLTTGGASVGVLDQRKVTDYLDADRQLRDQIIACFGVPPAKLGIIESGNLGGGTGEAQDKTFRVNTIIPIANLILEKLNFHLLMRGFGITDWHLEFAEIDFRDSKVVEEIRQIRLNSGAYTVNRWRAEIGEPPIDGGDDAILLDRQGPVFWADMATMSKATIAYRTAPLTAAGVNGYVPGVPDAELDPAPDPVAPVPDGRPQPQGPEDKPGLAGDAAQGEPPEELWDELYRQCLNEALARM
ncbi:phage portal protein, partial [Streptomyces sp. NPDC051173]|uniref:phage portal protein n=1 Tax=Streptomyces sp. NPDC051173 TaxID=3155164 RepID=UPI003450A6B1